MDTKAERLGRLLNVTANLFFDTEERLLYRQLFVQRRIKALDLGCGNGAYMAKLAACYPHMEWTGVELDEAMFSWLYAKARHALRGKRSFLDLKSALLAELRHAGFASLGTTQYALRAESLQTRKALAEYMRTATEYWLDCPISPERERELNDWLAGTEPAMDVPMFGSVFAKAPVAV